MTMGPIIPRRRRESLRAEWGAGLAAAEPLRRAALLLSRPFAVRARTSDWLSVRCENACAVASEAHLSIVELDRVATARTLASVVSLVESSACA